jgi:hypothetical protein
MRDDSHHNLGITLDQEIESPVPIHATLPHASQILLRLQRRMAQVLREEPDLLIESSLYLGWCGAIVIA